MVIRIKITSFLICTLASIIIVGSGVTAAIQTDDRTQHWAFKAPVRPHLPAVRNRSLVRTPIDYFIQTQLEKQGIEPNSETSKETLIRRLSLDLTGLPPTIEEIDAFLGDKSENSYGKLVERLLNSPHYGERWGRWWLDSARYADTNGYEKDLPRSIWPYRDWVIQAFNQNMPFDRFTIEQLAGDLMPDPTQDQLVATGFLRNSMQNQEGGVDPEQFRVEGLIDRVDAIGKSFLGLTVNCAQCHNHKFDPISQKEYFQFYAFVNSDDEPEIEVADDTLIAKRKEILSKIATIEDELRTKTPELSERMARWERDVARYEVDWKVLEGAEIYASFGVKFDQLPDKSFIAKGDNSTPNNYIITVPVNLKKITGIRLEVIADRNLPRSGPGRSPEGLLYISEFQAEAGKENIAFSKVTSDFSRPNYPVENLIDGDQKTHWGIDAGPGRRNQTRSVVFTTAKPFVTDPSVPLKIQIMQKFDDKIDLRGGKPNVGRFRLSLTDSENPQADPVPHRIRVLLNIPADHRTGEQKREIFGYYRTTVSEWAEQNSAIDDLMKGWPYGATTLALAERTVPRETRIFRRGDWKRPGEAVQPGTPSMLHPFPEGAMQNRLGLAQWIVDKKNPLTSRVIVNRIWQQYFGQGLVKTPEDFGTRSDDPSHPELLDWLAVEFIESGWNIKHIHRLIVKSAVYRRSSVTTQKLLDADPNNVLLARTPRIRVESEIVRDIALAASGLLIRKIGGPPVFPPIPDGVLSLGYGPALKWETSTGEDRYRRAMYTFWKRTVPYPSLLTFDSPNGDFSCTRRIRSNTPLQALTTLNDTIFMEAAQGLALRIYRQGGQDDRDKIIFGFRLCTGRRPDEFEIGRLMSMLRNQQEYFNGRTAAAVYVSSPDANNLPDDLDLHKVAPWTMVARVLLNLDETITRE